MRRNSYFNKAGFSAIELLIVLFVSLILLSSAGFGVMKAFDLKWKNDTQNNLQKLVNAFKAHYMELRDASARYDQNVFYWNNKSITPLVVTPSDTNSSSTTGSNIRVYNSSRSLFYDAGCSLVTATSDYAELSCTDQYGTPLQIVASSQRPVSSKSSYDDLVTPYFNPLVPVEITFTSAGADRQFGTADDITVSFSSADLDNYYVADTDTTLRNILQAIKEFQAQRLLTETVSLTYENSLSSYDDVKVPWVWQLYATPGQDPKSPCFISTVASCRPSYACICPYSAAQWSTVAYVPWSSNHVVYSQYAMQNLGIIPSVSNSSMVRDSFGMVVVLDLIANMPAAPPVPRDNYSYAVSPPFISVIRTSWGKSGSIALVN